MQVDGLNHNPVAVQIVPRVTIPNEAFDKPRFAVLYDNQDPAQPYIHFILNAPIEIQVTDLIRTDKRPKFYSPLQPAEAPNDNDASCYMLDISSYSNVLPHTVKRFAPFGAAPYFVITSKLAINNADIDIFCATNIQPAQTGSVQRSMLFINKSDEPLDLTNPWPPGAEFAVSTYRIHDAEQFAYFEENGARRIKDGVESVPGNSVIAVTWNSRQLAEQRDLMLIILAASIALSVPLAVDTFLVWQRLQSYERECLEIT